MRAADLKSGDALLTVSDGPISDTIEAVTGGRFSHAAMVVTDYGAASGKLVPFVYEMTWPRLKRTPLADWLAGTQAFVCPLRSRLSLRDEQRLADWWNVRLGYWYDVPLLFALAPVTWWQRFTYWLGWRGPLTTLQPIAGNGVCSVNVAWAWKAVGLPVTETTGMTPVDVQYQPFVLSPERVAALEEADA